MQYLTKGDRDTTTSETSNTERRSIDKALDALFYSQVTEVQMATDIYCLIEKYPNDFNTIFNRIMNATALNLWQRNPVQNAKDALQGLINHKYAFSQSAYDTIDGCYNAMKGENKSDRYNHIDNNANDSYSGVSGSMDNMQDSQENEDQTQKNETNNTITDNDGSDNQDGNNTLINTAIGSNSDWQTWYLDRRNEEWAREDKLRKEQQDRDDNAYQRMVKDMRAAGINPNVSGGGTPNYGTSAQSTSVSDTGASNSVQMSAQDQQAILTYAQIEMQLKKAEMEQATDEKKMELQKQLAEAEMALKSTSLGLNGSMSLINMIVSLATMFA